VSVTDFLGRLTHALESARIPYMLAGSLASSFHGEPRTTQDVDLIIHTTAAGVRRLASQLPDSDYYVDVETALDGVTLWVASPEDVVISKVEREWQVVCQHGPNGDSLI
jgi:hypothetical protein